MGTSASATQELRKPRLHVGFELAMKTGLLGDKPGAGIERAVAGGMHSVVIDESGRVRWSFLRIINALYLYDRVSLGVVFRGE